MPAKWQVARIVGHFALDPGPVQSRIFHGEHGPFVTVALPGGDVVLVAQDPVALGRLAFACARAQRQLRVAQARYPLPAPGLSEAIQP